MHEGIRGDHILWLEPGQSAASDLYLQLMDGLRQQLNRERVAELWAQHRRVIRQQGALEFMEDVI